MKTILTIILVLLASTSFAFTSATKAVVSSGASAASCVLSSCSGAETCTGNSGCLLRETFAGCAANCGSGCDNAWSVLTGSPVCNNTFPGTSMKSLGGAVTTAIGLYKNISLGSPVYIAGVFYTTSCSTSGNKELFDLEDNANLNAALRSVIPTPTCSYFGINSGGTNLGTYQISTSTKYYLKLRYTKGTGSDASVQWWYSTGGSWTSVDVTTNGTKTTDVTYVFLNMVDETSYLTDIRISNSDINFW